MRLIDADALIKALQERETEPNYQHEHEDWVIGLIMAEEIVWEQQTICIGCERVVVEDDRQ